MNIYAKKIHNDVLASIKDKNHYGIISQKDIIKALCPPYSEKELQEALDYISHSKVENSEDIPAQIVIYEQEITIGDNKIKDNGIVLINK